MNKRQAVGVGRMFLEHFVPAVMKPLRAIWNQIIGFLFLSFAVVFGFRTAAYVRDYASVEAGSGLGELVRLAMAGFFTVLMTWYGVTSFLKARRISRS